MKKYKDHKYADCPRPNQHHLAAHRLIEEPKIEASQYTPTPWDKMNQHSEDVKNLQLGIEWNIDPIKKNGIKTGDVQIWADVAEKNATFIVRAVNCHEELVEAIQWALSGEYVTQDGQRVPMVAGETRAMLEHALIKAVEK